MFDACCLMGEPVLPSPPATEVVPHSWWLGRRRVKSQCPDQAVDTVARLMTIACSGMFKDGPASKPEDKMAPIVISGLGLERLTLARSQCCGHGSKAGCC